jgi:hypothetical protein
MVNIDQTNIYLVPMVKEQTWKKQGKKRIVQIGVEDKHAIICVVSCITNGNLIPFQVVFKGKQISHLPWFCLTIVGQTYIHVNNL